RGGDGITHKGLTLRCKRAAEHHAEAQQFGNSASRAEHRPTEAEATLALWMRFLLGRQAIFGQEPPKYFRSITAARWPSAANAQARYLPASPLPSTPTS